MKLNEGSIVGALLDPIQIKGKNFEKKCNFEKKAEKEIGNKDRNSNGNENEERKKEEKRKEYKQSQSTSIHKKIMKTTNYCNAPSSGTFI